jgi:hypothetical protein
MTEKRQKSPPQLPGEKTESAFENWYRAVEEVKRVDPENAERAARLDRRSERFEVSRQNVIEAGGVKLADKTVAIDVSGYASDIISLTPILADGANARKAWTTGGENRWEDSKSAIAEKREKWQIEANLIIKNNSTLRGNKRRVADIISARLIDTEHAGAVNTIRKHIKV